MYPRSVVRPPISIPVPPPSIAPILKGVGGIGVIVGVVGLIGLVGGNQWRDGLIPPDREYDPDTGLTRLKQPRPEANGGQKSISAPPPFTGGQSPNVLYNVYGVTRTTYLSGTVITSSFGENGFVQVLGVVRGIQIIKGDRNAQGGLSFYSFTLLANPDRGMSGSNSPNIADFEAWITRIERSNGLPDTGGNIATPTSTAPSGYTGSPPEADRNRTAPPPLFNPNTQPNRRPSLEPSENPNGDPQERREREPNRFGFPIPNGGNLQPPSSQNQNQSNSTTNLAPSPRTAPPPITFPPPPGIDRKPIIPPTKKEEDKRIAPPPVITPPPPIAPPVDLSGIIAQLAQIGAISALINANTQPDALKQAAKTGSCESLKSPACTQDMENRIKNPLDAKLDAAQIARDANAASQTALLTGLATGQTGILLKIKETFDFLNKVWQNEAINKAMMYVTMITTIHNAAMLSRGLVDTLGSALDSGLQVFGWQIKDKEGNQLGVSAALGQTFQNLIRNVIGQEKLDGLNLLWTQSNRIYQSGINLLSNVQSIIDSSTAVAELTSNRLGTLMNAMRNVGGVRENAYGAQSQNVTKFNGYLEKLNNLEAGVSNFASITGNIVSVQQSVKEFNDNRKGLDDALKDKPIGSSIASNTPETEAKAVKRDETIYTIKDFSIVKPPETEP